MTVAPRAAAWGASSREMSAPAEKRAMSTPSNASPARLADLDGSGRRSTIVRPADRPDASRRSSPTGNSRSMRTWIIVRPTTPVAPTTATVRGWSCHVGHGSAEVAVTGRARREYSSGASALRPHHGDLGRTARGIVSPGAAPSSARDGRAARTRPARRPRGRPAVASTRRRRSRSRGSSAIVRIRQLPTPSPRADSSTNTSQTQANVTRSVITRANPTWRPSPERDEAQRPRRSRPRPPPATGPAPSTPARTGPGPASRGRCPPGRWKRERRSADRRSGCVSSRGSGHSAVTGSLARCRCMAALRDRLTRPWRSISVTTTMTSSPTDTTSSTVGTW